LITLLTTPVVVFIQTLPMVVQCTSSFDRIQEYCNYTSSSDIDSDHETGPADQQTEPDVDLLIPELSNESNHNWQKPVISLQNQNFGWSRDDTAFLKNIQLDIKRESFTAIIGPVGSGKSVLLNSILGEMISTSHTKKGEWQGVMEPTAYCAQQPWLENGTIRQNIIAASAYDKEWYIEVKSSCGLDDDIKQLEEGDQAHIGSKGLSLSGGQKQRIVRTRPSYHQRCGNKANDIFTE
jgi:ATP-binding cassette subfamily C (CFTR/MRP) protein 1